MVQGEPKESVLFKGTWRMSMVQGEPKESVFIVQRNLENEYGTG